MAKYPKVKRARRAHTIRDQRYTTANKLNNGKIKCREGNLLTATQDGTFVTVKCACGHSHTTNCVGIFNEYDAIGNFNDTHP